MSSKKTDISDDEAEPITDERSRYLKLLDLWQELDDDHKRRFISLIQEAADEVKPH
ncbi:hypothetical protein AB4Z13_15455 [Rhizobium sp. YAF28]|uniref:hypothetical protein n=1 Tax=Rhizobium sp. YAF28 TaxID=3233081 RepID=UPI003F9A7B93